MDVGKAAGLALAAAVFSLAAPATAQRVEPNMDSDRAAAADAAAVQAYVAARQQADASAPEAPPVETVSEAVQRVTHWIQSSGDNNGLPFIVIDKLGAEVFVFDAQGQPLGKAPALLGISLGDDSVPGVGERELRKIPVADRTTPAGRFVAKFGLGGGRHGGVLWVDYATAVSLHPVITSSPKEHRMQRIKSPTPNDNRITFGCINVPASFYTGIVRPIFKDKAAAVVYILPDTKPLNEVFPAMVVQQAAL